MSKTKKLSGAVVAALLLCTGLVLALLPGAASAAPGRVYGTEYFVLSSSDIDGNNATATVHGLFDASGRDHTGSMRDILHLGPGRFEIRHPDSQSQFSYKMNQKTCELVYTVTGEYTLHDATGRFTGIRGHGTYIGRFSATFAHNADGSCNLQSEPISASTTIRARGPASLPAA